MIELHCSWLPRVALCPTAAQPPTARINWGNELSRLGQAGHEGVAEVIRHRPFELNALAKKYHVDAADLARAVWPLIRTWGDFASAYPEPKVEVEMSFHDSDFGVMLKGTCDLFSNTDSVDEGRIADWKTGFSDADHEEQLKGYAFLASYKYDLKRVHAVVLHSRLRKGEGWLWTREELDQWWDALVVRVLAKSDPTPGNHCKYCPRFGDCAAGREYVRKAGEALVEFIGQLSGPLTNDQLVQFGIRRRLLLAACEVARDYEEREVLARGRIENKDGVIARVESSDGGDALQICESVRKEIDYRSGVEILKGEIGPNWEECIAVVKGRAEELVRESAPRNCKAAAVRGLMHKLDQAGAINVKTQNRLEYKRLR